MAKLIFLTTLTAIIEPRSKVEAVMSTMDVIKVRTDANPAKVAGAIAKAIRKLDYNPVGQVEVRAVGERATYLASRAIEKARGFLADEAPDGYELSTSIVSECVELSGKDNLTIVFQLGWQQKRNEVA